MSSWSEFLANVTTPLPAYAPAPAPVTPAPAPAPAPAVEPILSNRHLLLVESIDTISKTEIAASKYDDVDVIYVTRETLYEVYDQMAAYKTTWRSVNLLFHGSASLDDQSISIFGMKMSMNRNIMMKDPQVQGMARFISAISLMAHDSVYIYTCAVGIADGLKELCIHLDEVCGLTNGIFLSTNNTGQPPSGDWRIEWGTKRGFLVDGLHDNEIEHAQNDLFRDISKLTFELANTPSNSIINVTNGLSLGNTVQKYKIGQIVWRNIGKGIEYYMIRAIKGKIPVSNATTNTNEQVYCIRVCLGVFYKSSSKFYVDTLTFNEQATGNKPQIQPSLKKKVQYNTNTNTYKDTTDYSIDTIGIVNPFAFQCADINFKDFKYDADGNVISPAVTAIYKSPSNNYELDPVITQIWRPYVTTYEYYNTYTTESTNEQIQSWGLKNEGVYPYKNGNQYILRNQITTVGLPNNVIKTDAKYETSSYWDTEVYNGVYYTIEFKNTSTTAKTIVTKYNGMSLISTGTLKPVLYGGTNGTSPLYYPSRVDLSTDYMIPLCSIPPTFYKP
jgi:hypothetical protein